MERKIENIMNKIEKNCERMNLLLEKYLHTFLYERKNSLFKAIQYSLLSGGKRIRPFLVYQIGYLFKIPKKFVDAIAVAIECIHVYSLIHDDLPAIDNDQYRHNKLSCHAKFGESIAILAGNSLQSLAFIVLSDRRKSLLSLETQLKIIYVLSEAIGANKMCLGQMMDIEMKKNDVSEEEILTIYRRKTGSLIQASVEMGIIIAKKENTLEDRYLNQYSNYIGVAFQLKDDILDHEKDDSVYNKHDFRQLKRKSTYLNLFGLNQSKSKMYKLTNRAIKSLRELSNLGYDTESLISFTNYVIERKE